MLSAASITHRTRQSTYPTNGIHGRSAIKYLEFQLDMDMWLAPLACTRLMVPYRASVPTPVGLGVLQATQFDSMLQPARSTATILKTQ